MELLITSFQRGFLATVFLLHFVEKMEKINSNVFTRQFNPNKYVNRFYQSKNM